MKKADALHNDQFVPRIKKILVLSDDENAVKNAELHETDKNADIAGAELMGLLNDVEQRAKEKMDAVVQSVVVRTLIGTLAAAILAIGGGLFLATKITGPLNEAIALAGRMSDGDLTGSLTVTQKDETGVLGDALNTMSVSCGSISGGYKGCNLVISATSVFSP